LCSQIDVHEEFHLLDLRQNSSAETTEEFDVLKVVHIKLSIFWIPEDGNLQQKLFAGFYVLTVATKEFCLLYPRHNRSAETVAGFCVLAVEELSSGSWTEVFGENY
jgi:hypothetical protein